MTDRRVFTVPGKPVGKGRPKFRRIGAGVQTYTPEKTADYEALVRWAYTTAHGGKEPFAGQVVVRMDAYFEVPKSWPKKKQQLAVNGSLRPAVKPDADNIAKVICDALNGIAYMDDKQVVTVTVRKWYAAKPCVLVEVIG